MAVEGETYAGSETPLTDLSTLRDFYEENLSKIYGYFLNRCGGDVSVAEDLTQETFLGAVREIRKGAQIAHPPAWIRGIARHKLMDFLRSKSRDRMQLVGFDPDEAEPTVPWDPGSGHQRAVSALGAVHESQRAALVLRYLDGMSVPEVASALGRSVGATESLLSRGKESFRRAYLEASHE